MSLVQSAGLIRAHVRRTKLMAAKQKLGIALAKPQFDFAQGLGSSYKGAGPAQGNLACAASAYAWAER